MRLATGRHKERIRLGRFFVMLIVLGALAFAVYTILPSPQKSQAREAVEQFYTSEQAGNFGGSWELFHSQMKEIYPKESYIQQRAKVFMEDFGATTFNFELGTMESVTGWSMTANSPAFDMIYKIPVTQTFQSVFGVLSIVQDVYVAKELDRWNVLWPFSEPAPTS